MRTYRHLYEQVWAFANLHQAWKKARKGKRGADPWPISSATWRTTCWSCSAELLATHLPPRALPLLHIHEPKRRLISAAPFRDRVVHHALCNVIEPLFERRFIADSLRQPRGQGHPPRPGPLPGSLPAAIRYVLQCDVRAVFPQHRPRHPARPSWRARSPTPRCCALIDHILASGAGVLSEEYEMRYFPGDDLLAAAAPARPAHRQPHQPVLGQRAT